MYKFRTKEELRLIEARQLIQERFLLEHFGYVIINKQQVDRSGWSKEVVLRLNRRLDRLSGRHLNQGNNSLRAGDIIQSGEKSKWYDGRFSPHHSGSDKRGIAVWLQRFAREGHLDGHPLKDQLLPARAADSCECACGK